MKNIFKILFLSILLVTITSCDNKDSVQLTLAPQGVGVITAPAEGTTIVLNPAENQTNQALAINWTASSYGTPTEVTYMVELAQEGTNFESPFKAVSTTNRYAIWNVGELNNIAVSAGLTPFLEGGMDIRITSTVGTTGSLLQISEPITIFVTPFTTDLPKIAVPGNHQGWDPASAPLLAASAFAQTDYEGYIWLDGEFKFLAPNETGGFFWGNTDWGDDGTSSGILIDKDGESNANAETAGYYFVKADTNALTYSITSVNWGIIGAATPTGWDSDTDLVYDAATKTLSVNIDLISGQDFKFRGNNEWGAFDLGTLDSDGLLQGGGNLTLNDPSGNYHVVLDLSNPRAYTFTLTAN
ncbi:MAG: DUF5116 domain-containing protein [Flavobacteriaceae bacterium]|nr:MAG: DUF5116 domain-containing protein [Flavobacteriaceae bacterium]